MGEARCYIFDLDGTLCNIDHRLHFIKGDGKKDWRSFFAACVDDEPYQHIVDLARQLFAHWPVLFVSGRSEEVRGETEQWLRRYNLLHVDPGTLRMRSAGDYRPDHEVKSDILDGILADHWEPIMAFDDRDQVVAMWRARGIPCAQVAPGDF